MLVNRMGRWSYPESAWESGLDVSEKGLTLIVWHSDFCVVMCAVNMLIKLWIQTIV